MGRDISTVGSVRIELRLAGMFGVIRDGAELTEGELGSRKSRTLLKLLAVERPGLVPVDRIIDVLWADDPPAAAEQNVASLVSRLRGVLGSGVILGGRRGYRLAGSAEVSIDLDTAGHALRPRHRGGTGPRHGPADRVAHQQHRPLPARPGPPAAGGAVPVRRAKP